MDGAGRSNPEGDLRVAAGTPARGRRAGRRTSGQPSRRVAAPAGAQGRRSGDRPAGWNSADLPGRTGWAGRAARRPGAVLGASFGRLQGGGRTSNRGERMSTHTQMTATTITSSIVVDAPIDLAFRVFTEDFGAFKPASHNLLAVEIAETVFEPRVGGCLYD